jgi:hypothetical protein
LCEGQQHQAETKEYRQHQPKRGVTLDPGGADDGQHKERGKPARDQSAKHQDFRLPAAGKEKGQHDPR